MIGIEDALDSKINNTNVENFAFKHLELLDLERDAEIDENKCLQESTSVKHLQKKGICIPKVRLGRSSTGLFGRSLLQFESFWGSSALPSHTISSGDIVGVGNVNSDGKIEIITSGVVTRVSELTITLAFEKNSNFTDVESDVRYIIIKLANDVTYKRLKRCLKNLQTATHGSQLIDVLFGSTSPSVYDKTTFEDISFTNDKLNEDQKEAVRFSLSQKEVAIIHGPPGTGKTTTLIECIFQAVSQKLKILACAPSNVAVDNLVEKLSSHPIKMVRLGHPARVLTNIQKYSLDSIVSHYDGSDVVDELRKEIDKLRGQINKTKGSKNRKSLWAENKFLLKEVKEREKFIVKRVLGNAEVVLCTLTSGSDDGPLKYVEKNHFDVCFIDECSQAVEAACWIPLLQVKRCILAGDHNQLPPTIISQKAAKGGLNLTLMERLLSLHGDTIKRMLTTQYRMNELIMKWPSEQLYEDKLKAHETVCTHLLTDIPGVESNEDTSIPLLMIDTSGCGLNELQVEDDESKGNEGEADLVATHVENLIKSGMCSSDIAVITPYNLQVELIKSRLSSKHPKLEIKSVDGFQGREKEAVVLSLVRSNDVGGVGFLSEDRRINVAITRAKRHLAVVCDSKTVSCHPFLKSFVTYCEEKGEVRSAFQYERDIGNYPSRVLKQTCPAKKENKVNGRKKVDVKKELSKPEFSNEKDNFSTRENERRFTEEKYTQIIEGFLRSQRSSYEFPSSLSAYERRTVHEIAEKLNLIHVSSEEGEDRYIQLQKKLDGPLATSTASISTVEIPLRNNFETISEHLTKDESSPSCDIPREMRHNQKPVVKAASVKPKPPPKSKLKVLQLKEGSDPDDFDSLIEQVVKADKTCRFEKCKKCVATLSQVCEFCKGRFCFSHFMPEIHGCGLAVKAHARSQIRKDKVLYAGSGKPQKKVDPIAHTYLQKKLDKKLSELSNQRKAKPKE